MAHCSGKRRRWQAGTAQASDPGRSGEHGITSVMAVRYAPRPCAAPGGGRKHRPHQGRNHPSRGVAPRDGHCRIRDQPSYALSPCEVMSRPSRSASSLTRRPTVYFTTR